MACLPNWVIGPMPGPGLSPPPRLRPDWCRVSLLKGPDLGSIACGANIGLGAIGPGGVPPAVGAG